MRAGPIWAAGAIGASTLGTSAAQSAVASYWPDTGRLEALAAFPTEPDFKERGLRDGVGDLYQNCARRGELIQTGGEAVNVEGLIREARDRFGAPAGLASDRWREAELKDALKAAGLPLAKLELRGMGYRDGGEDVRQFRRLCLEGKVTPWPSLLLANRRCQRRAPWSIRLAMRSWPRTPKVVAVYVHEMTPRLLASWPLRWRHVCPNASAADTTVSHSVLAKRTTAESAPLA